MSKQNVLAALLLGLAFLAPGTLGQGIAAPPLGWNPSTDAGFQGLPDRDPTSARFLVVSGPGSSTLPGGEGEEGESFISLSFDLASAADPVRVALFDPNSIGLWDQRVDRRLLTVAPNVRYRLYADPTGDAVARLKDADLGNNPVLVQETDAYSDYNGLAGADDDWCSFHDAPASATPGALTPIGDYRFLLRITIEPAPGQVFLQGPERCGHKVAFNGTYLLPAGTTIGFAGGAIDERTVVGTESQLIHSTEDPDTVLVPNLPGDRHYNGIIQFHLRGTHACFGNIFMEEADADFQAAVLAGQDLSNPLQNPTGVPPDNVPFYSRPGDSTVFDVSEFLILDPASPGGLPRPIRWSLFPTGVLHTSPPSGATPANPPFSSAATTASGRPSLDFNQQPGVFQGATLDQATLLASPDLWCLRWESVDKANFIFMRFNRNVGTTPLAPRVEGRVFCDENGNNTYDAGIDHSLGVSVGISVQRVDCDTDAPLGAPIDVATALDGTWSIDQVLPGCYRVALGAAVPFTPAPGVVLPLEIEVAEDECEENVDIPLVCTQSICGLVFCDVDGNCIWNAAVDTALPPGSNPIVTVQALDDLGDPTGLPIEVAPSGVEWCVDNLPFGRYRVTAAAGTLSIVAGCIDSYEIDLDATTIESQETLNLNFAFDCAGTQLSGRVFCEGPEADCDGIYEAGVDTPVAGVLVELVVNAVVTDTDVTDAAGLYSFEDLQIGPVYTTRVANTPANAALLAGKTGPTPTQWVVDTNTDDPTTGLDFAYCVRQVSGRVFCEGGMEPCDGIWQPEADEPLAGILVELVQNGLVVDTTLTGADGRYAFGGIAPGVPYLTRVADTPANAAIIAEKSGPTPPTQPFNVGPTETRTDLDFAYCNEAQISGRVFCEGPEADCDGTYDAGIDTPVAGVLVELLQGAVVVDTDLTGADGLYAFVDLLADAVYTTRVANTPANAALLAGKSGPAPASHTVDTGSDVLTGLDFAYCVRQVSGRVFCEGGMEPCDGIWQPEADEPLVGILVELVQNGLVVDTTLTGADGRFAFGGIAPGVPYLTRVADTPANAAIIAGKSGPTPPTQPFNVGPTETRTDLDFSYCNEAQISGRVFCEGPEADCDGVYDAGVDTPVAGVLVELLQGAVVVDTDLTGADGMYAFVDLLADAVYTTRVANTPANAALLAGKSGPVPASHTVDTGSDVLTGLDFAYCVREVSGRIWCEGGVALCDGIWVPAVDVALAGVLVELVQNGLVVDTTLTGADGRYEFGGIAPGVPYLTRVADTPANALIVAGKSGPTPPTQPFNVGPTETRTDLDFVYCEESQISGRVFCEGPEADCDGVYDAGIDTPVAGVLVELIRNGGVVATDLTGADGSYAFTGLLADEVYTTRVADTPANAALLANKAGPVPPSHTVDTGSDVLTGLDFAYCVRQASGRVFCEGGETPCDGIWQPQTDLSVAGIEIELLREGLVIATTLTGADGRYEFDNLLPNVAYTTRVADTAANAALLAGKTGPSPEFRFVVVGPFDTVEDLDFAYCAETELSGRVFCEGPDADCDGIYDADIDTPIVGVLIELVFNGDAIATDVTDATGSYSFAGLLTNAVYTTRVADTPANAALIGGKSGPVPPQHTVNTGIDPLTGLDFAYCVRQASGRVFCEGGDFPCDGVWQPAEDIPLGGILIELLRNGIVIDTTLTGADGRYEFENLAPNVAYTTRVADNAANAALLNGKSGPTPATRLALVGPFSQVSDLDFAYCKEICVQTVCICVYLEPRDRCDRVFTPGVDRWLDCAEVFIRRAGDTEGYLASGITDENGMYCWTGLEPGRYVVYVGGNQEHLGLLPCDVYECPITLLCNEDIKCEVGTCERCPRIPTCEGEIHEFEVEVDLQLCGAEAECLPFEVVLYDGCDANASVLDRLEGLACADGLTETRGLDGVVEVVDFKWEPWGIATARVRLLAHEGAFPDGTFGSASLRLVVRLGEDTAEGCARFRAEEIRPGSWFAGREGCLTLPPCDVMIADPYAWLPAEGCYPRFLVLEVLSKSAWRACEGSDDGTDDGTDDGSDDGSEPCEPLNLNLSFRIPASALADPSRVVNVELVREADGVVLDTIALTHRGLEWIGELTGRGGLLSVLTSEKLADEGDFVRWIVCVRIERPCCPPHDEHGLLALIRGTVGRVAADEDLPVLVCRDLD